MTAGRISQVRTLSWTFWVQRKWTEDHPHGLPHPDLPASCSAKETGWSPSVAAFCYLMSTICVLFPECRAQIWMTTFLRRLPCKHRDHLLMRTGSGEEIIHSRVNVSPLLLVEAFPFQSGTFVFHVAIKLHLGYYRKIGLIIIKQINPICKSLTVGSLRFFFVVSGVDLHFNCPSPADCWSL